MICKALGRHVEIVRTTKQKVVASYTHTLYPYEDQEGYSEDYNLRLLVCPSCLLVNLTCEDENGEVSLFFPSPPKELEGLPSSVSKAYKAARAVRTIDPNAFA